MEPVTGVNGLATVGATTDGVTGVAGGELVRDKGVDPPPGAELKTGDQLAGGKDVGAEGAGIGVFDAGPGGAAEAGADGEVEGDMGPGAGVELGADAEEPAGVIVVPAEVRKGVTVGGTRLVTGEVPEPGFGPALVGDTNEGVETPNGEGAPADAVPADRGTVPVAGFGEPVGAVGPPPGAALLPELGPLPEA